MELELLPLPSITFHCLVNNRLVVTLLTIERESSASVYANDDDSRNFCCLTGEGFSWVKCVLHLITHK